MQYLCYMEKNNPDIKVKIEYAGTLDIKIVAAVSFILAKWSIDSSLPMVLDAIQWDLDYDVIFKTFDEHCIIVKDDALEILNKDVVMVADLFS